MQNRYGLKRLRIEMTVCARRKQIAPSPIIYLHLIYTLRHTVRFVSHTMKMNGCAPDSHQPAAAQYPRNGRKRHTWRDCREGGNNDCNTAQLGVGSKYISNRHFLPCAPDRSATRFRKHWSSSDTQPDCTWPFGATSMCCVSVSVEGFWFGSFTLSPRPVFLFWPAGLELRLLEAICVGLGPRQASVLLQRPYLSGFYDRGFQFYLKNPAVAAKGVAYFTGKYWIFSNTS